MHGPELTSQESLREFKVAGLSVLGGVAVGMEVLREGFTKPLALFAGVGATALLLKASLGGFSRQESYPPHRGLDI